MAEREKARVYLHLARFAAERHQRRRLFMQARAHATGDAGLRARACVELGKLRLQGAYANGVGSVGSVDGDGDEGWGYGSAGECSKCVRAAHADFERAAHQL